MSASFTDLSGRVSVVTGGSRGIGYAAGLALAQSGSAVALFDLDGEQARDAAARIAQATGVDARGYAADVRSRALAVDVANWSLMTDFLPVHAARGLGLHLAARVGFFRRALMRQGLGRSESAPHFGRGERL